MESNQFFFDMRGSFFLLKLGKTSSGGVGKDRLKKVLGKNDVGWSNTWWDRNVLLRARNALRRAPVDFVSVLKKNTFTLHAMERWLLENLFWTFTMKLLISFISYKTTDTYLFQLIILDILQLLALRNSILVFAVVLKQKKRHKIFGWLFKVKFQFLNLKSFSPF